MYLDIGKIKRNISILQVLEHYGTHLKRRNNHQLYGACPIHQGDNPNAFQVNVNKNLFHCFTHCGGGTIFDLVMKIDHLNFYQAALKIWKLFYEKLEIDNCTIKSFKLSLQNNHPYLEKRKINPALANYFQLGFCNYGMMKNRIAIPIIDKNKNIVAYCGRAVDQNYSPKYLFPKNFKKNNHLFNIQNIIPGSSKPLVIVEGFFDCIHLVKMGFNSVALMGSTISINQLKLLKESKRLCVLMMDGDHAGKKATFINSNSLKTSHIPFRSIYLNQSLEPENLDQITIKIILNCY